jgi:8-oxo-dGTP diphosphatase
MKLNYSIKKFEHVIVAVDVVIFTVRDDSLQVLLLELNEHPFVGKWAVPGGLVKTEESLEQAVGRHLANKIGVSDVFVEQLYTFGDIGRDPRGRVISVAYYALVREKDIKVTINPRYSDIKWVKVGKLPEMAYDHAEIIKTAWERLQAKISYTNVVYSLLPQKFTLTQLQRVYEIILGKVLDKRNFRKKILSLGVIEELDETTRGEPTRPARLYKFRSQNLQVIEIL